MVLTQKYNPEKLGRHYLTKFYLARFWRLYPTYLIICSIVVLLGLLTPYVKLPTVLNLGNDVSYLSYSRSLLTWLSNITMLFLNLPSTSDLLIAPGWSLGIEISFYLIAPFALRLKTLPLIALSLVGIFLQLIPYGQHSPVLFGFHFFLLGALARRHTAHIESVISRIANPSLYLLYGITLFIVAFALSPKLGIGAVNSHAHNSWDRIVYPLLMAVLVPLLHERTKSNKIDGWIGQLSYPFYLVHAVLIEAFSLWDDEFKAPQLLLMALFASAMLVIFDKRLVEPWRSHFSRRQA